MTLRLSPGLRYMLTAAVFFSLMGLFVRLVKEIPFIEVVVFRAMISLVISAALVFASPMAGRMPVEAEWLLLLGVGVTTQIAQVAMTRGLRLEHAARATVVNYLVIFLLTAYSLVLGENLSMYSFFGMTLIVAGISLLTMQRIQKISWRSDAGKN